MRVADAVGAVMVNGLVLSRPRLCRRKYVYRVAVRVNRAD